jgi:hypothetical protein
MLNLPSTDRLHLVFHVNNLRPCSIASLRHGVGVTTQKVMMTSLKSLTSMMCAPSRYLDNEENICSSVRTSTMTTFHPFGTAWTKYIQQQHYNIFWKHPSGTRWPGLMRAPTSCTPIRRAFLSPINGFTEGAKTTTEVGQTVGLNKYVKRGRVRVWRVQSNSNTLYIYMTL